MCDQDAKQPLARFFPPADDARASAGSRRQRLWELPANTHCPVIGVCLPLGVLRKLVNKGVRGNALADDYEIHVGAVAECANRNRISNLLQDALDQRYALVLQRFRAARSGEAVMQMWRQAIAAGDVAGAFWASLTHPRSDFLVQDTVLREMHMIQHQAGATTRVDHVRFQDLQDAHAALETELAQSRQRHARALADKTRELDEVLAQLMRARSELVARDSRIAFLQGDMEELAASVPELEARVRLKHKLDEAGQRVQARDAQVAELRQQLAAATRRIEQLETARATEHEAPEAISDAAIELTDKTLLCVGGRSASVASYRCMTEEAGARFAHHDGGQEHGADLLEANLAAADLVICQTGCISHNAYWKVKEYCKRTGKQCVFVENPSSTSFSRGLKQIAIAIS